ncbi:hypothetical protein Golax_021671 [Gossypium laxum]|uniref:DUF7745 domain-containing protein n=1 Tax=Gossypium laxum TaxID=34288 RepID=A0A7J9ANQ1_9ROSI|nr:hypothetical protein [Gossypium laxum]
MCFRDKYGNVAQLLFVKMNDTLLKALVHFWDPTYRCFMFNEMDMSGIRDDMGKTSDDRHLTLFAFAVCGLIMFLKALGYVSVELADFLFQIEKGVNPAQESYLKPSFHSISLEGKETGILSGL